MKTREELEQEIERLTAQLKTAEETIEAFKRAQLVSLEATSKERQRSEGLNLEIEDLRRAVEIYRNAVFMTKETARTFKECLCGCGKQLVYKGKGRHSKFLNDTHRQRYNRQQNEVKKAEKILRSKKHVPDNRK